MRVVVAMKVKYFREKPIATAGTSTRKPVTISGEKEAEPQKAII